MPNIYYKFLKPPFSCVQYAVNGCWKVEVVTRNGCPTALSVQLDQERTVLAHLAGKLRRNRIRVLAGDRVTLELSPYDLTKGRITYRHK